MKNFIFRDMHPRSEGTERMDRNTQLSSPLPTKHKMQVENCSSEIISATLSEMDLSAIAASFGKKVRKCLVHVCVCLYVCVCVCVWMCECPHVSVCVNFCASVCVSVCVNVDRSIQVEG